MVAAVIWLFISTVARRTQAEPSPPTVLEIPVRQSVLLDAADGRLDQADLFSSSIAISGAQDESEIAAYCEQLAYFERRLQQQLKSCHGDRDRAATILHFIHDRILVGEYDAGCCDLRRTFDQGNYNCVTATILFQTLSLRNGLHVVAIALPGHVRCQLHSSDGSAYDIETTSRDGAEAEFDGSDPLSHVSRRLSETELLAKLIYNQGLEFLDRCEYSGALEATELAWQLDPQHDSARENVAVVVNNWSLRLSGEGEFSRAIQLLEQGRSVVPDYELLKSNQIHIYLRWIESALERSDSAEVALVRSLARKVFPGHPALGTD